MYEKYGSKVAFYIVYIEEAHSSDLWQMESNVKQGVVFRDPRTLVEREAVAQSCVRGLKIRIPALLDGIENRVEAQYTGWPDRLYLIGVDGKVKYKSEPGPFGFHPEGLEKAIEQAVGG